MSCRGECRHRGLGVLGRLAEGLASGSLIFARREPACIVQIRGGLRARQVVVRVVRSRAVFSAMNAVVSRLFGGLRFITGAWA